MKPKSVQVLPENFVPPYCPRPECKFHLLKYQVNSTPDSTSKQPSLKFYNLRGWQRIGCYPYKIRRYQCKGCSKSFSNATFQLEYRKKRKGLDYPIWKLFITGTSNRHIGRELNCSEHLVRGRLNHMARQGLLRHAEFMQSLTLEEPVAADGLQNFSGSQYEPNNINEWH